MRSDAARTRRFKAPRCQPPPKAAAHLAAALIAWCLVTPLGAAQFGRAAQSGNASERGPGARLLREGSTLVEASAHLRRRGDPGGWWVLSLTSVTDSIANDGSSSPRELIVLPCTRLMEMERIISAAPPEQASNMRFEVSGRVYVFRDRNYILPTHAAVISDVPSPVVTAPSPAAAPDHPPVEAAAGATQPASAPDDDDSAEAIARALQQQAGPLARSSARVAATPVQEAPRTTEPLSDAAIGGSSRDRPPAWPEHTAVVNRRGKITRERSGGWRLVLDADASRLADPPLRLLPCRLLEDIEDYARRTGNNSPVVVTGQLYLYNGQNYLLPTVYRIPRETSRLTP